MATFKHVNGERVELTPDEETLHLTRQAEDRVNDAIKQKQLKINALVNNELDKAARASISGQITAIENMNEATLDAALNAAGLS